MSPRQQRFVEEYLVDLNATAAYKRAGYRATGNAAEAAASRLLRNVKVAQAVEAAQADRTERTSVRAEQVLQDLAAIAFSDIGDLVEFTGDGVRIRAAAEIPAAARRALASVKVLDDGTIEFKLWNKIAALHQLALHLGLLKSDVQHRGKVQMQIAEELTDTALSGIVRSQP